MTCRQLPRSRRARPSPPFSPSPLLVSLLLSGSAGCHLFEGFAIDCLAGQPCARQLDDTGVDTADSGTPVPTTGWIASVTDGSDAAVFAYNADGEPLKSWTGLAAAFADEKKLGPYAGAVAYNRNTGAGIVTVNGSWATLDSRGETVTFGFTYDNDVEITDVEYADDNYYWFAVHDNVYAYDIPHQVTHPLFPEGLGEATGIGMGDHTVFTSDWVDNHPDVYALAVNHSAVDPVAVDVPGDADLSRNPFAGPDDAPFGCAKTGAIYAILGLVDGSETGWVAHLDQGLDDITDCGWDPGDGSWLLFSKSTGIWRIGADGSETNVVDIPRNSLGMRANFFR